MTLTLRLNAAQTKSVNYLKEMYFQKRATTAIINAIDYVVNHKEANEKKIENLTDQLELALSNGEDIQLLLNLMKKKSFS